MLTVSLVFWLVYVLGDLVISVLFYFVIEAHGYWRHPLLPFPSMGATAETQRISPSPAGSSSGNPKDSKQKSPELKFKKNRPGPETASTDIPQRDDNPRTEDLSRDSSEVQSEESLSDVEYSGTVYVEAEDLL